MRMGIMIKTPPSTRPHTFHSVTDDPAVTTTAARAPGFVIKSLWHRCARAHHRTARIVAAPSSSPGLRPTPGFLDRRRRRDTRARIAVRIHRACRPPRETRRRGGGFKNSILTDKKKKTRSNTASARSHVPQTAAENPARAAFARFSANNRLSSLFVRNVEFDVGVVIYRLIIFDGER